MSEPMGPADVVTLTIDGKEVTVPKGTLIIRAAEQLGIEIPRFCDHPLLDPVGACRQCYVEVEGQRKLMTSCTTPVVPDMVVRTQYSSEQAKEAQEAVLEFLLLNHPLDCPICDRGGECPLQDQALAFGPGESRYVESKRNYEKPIPLSPLVGLDRERCVLCARCTRFCDQVSGDRFIELFDRGAAEQVSIAPGQDFRSPFSGNTVQICPVGALTATPYRFAARPFDLKAGDGVCPHCASGCAMRIDTRNGEVVRHLARDNYDVNDAWLCDKGRFAFRFADSSTRLTTPLIREHGLEPASFGEALDRIAGWVREGQDRVAFLAGGRLSDEDAYALSKVARAVFRTNDLDHRRHLGDVPLEVESAAASGAPGVTYRDVERAKVIVVAGLDAEQELPILHLRIRKAARRGAKVFVIHPRRTRLWDVAEHLLVRPGHEAEFLSALSAAAGGGDPDAERVSGEVRAASGAAVVIAGERLGASPGALAAARAFAAANGAGFAYVTRRANDRGALRAGVHPALLPGGRPVADAAARAEVERAWGLADGWLPEEPGRDTRGILEAAARREIDVLFLLGTDPVEDFPDRDLATRALQNVPRKVVVDLFADTLSIFADVMLPAAAYLEKDGHLTDWEGRAQRFRPVRSPIGIARPDREILAGLARAMDADLGFASLDELHEEMGQLLAPRGAPAAVDGGPASTPGASTGDGLTLFTYHLLVDEGRLSRGADELKAALQEPAFAELHPADAERLGVADGATVTLTTEVGTAELPARVTDGIAEGAVFVPFNNPGLQANTLLAGSFVTPVTVEAASKDESEAQEVSA